MFYYYTVQITYYGHACFGVNVAGKNLLFDPFIRPNELAKHVDVSTLPADYIFLSHGHFDHIADALEIANRTGAAIISNYEVVTWFEKQGAKKTHPMNPGGKWKFKFGSAKLVAAVHSSSMPDGTYGGSPGAL